MTNSKFILPRPQANHKARIQEVIIPAPEARVLISIITEAFIPQLCKPSFKVKALNEIQSKVFLTAFASDINVLIFVSTGSRKQISHSWPYLEFLKKINLKSNGEIDMNSFKVAYIAPMKDIVSEICGNLNYRLSEYG